MILQRVNFEIAKLLKEKGFEWPCNSHYEVSLTEQVHEEDGTSGPFGWEKGEVNIQSDFFINNHKDIDVSNKAWYLCARPTQALVCKWLRDVHGLCISTRPWLPDDSNPKGQYEYFIYKDMDEDNPLYEDDSFRDTYEQAEEAGIEYCLKNLM